MKEVKLPSGATLKILSTPFSESKALYQAILEEAKAIQITTGLEMTQVIKDIFCAGFSSKKVDTCLKVCLSRCTYNGSKVDDSVFEPESARQDYTKVCIEVIEDNCGPFLKGLSVELNRILTLMPSSQT